VPGGVELAVRVVPRAARSQFAGVRRDALLVRLAAPPVDGAANDALVAFLASALDRPRRAVTIRSGLRSRNKQVAIAGRSEAEVRAVLAPWLDG